jgi:hypothetical protein
VCRCVIGYLKAAAPTGKSARHPKRDDEADVAELQDEGDRCCSAGMAALASIH